MEDGVFSWSAYTSLRSVVRSVEMAMPMQDPGKLSTALSVAKTNLYLVPTMGNSKGHRVRSSNFSRHVIEGQKAAFAEK